MVNLVHWMLYQIGNIGRLNLVSAELGAAMWVWDAKRGSFPLPENDDAPCGRQNHIQHLRGRCRRDAQRILKLMLKDDVPRIQAANWVSRDLRQFAVAPSPHGAGTYAGHEPFVPRSGTVPA
jgi:hypothetical protein